MAYRMTEISDNVRVGVMSDGALNIEIWENKHGWKIGVESDCADIILDRDSVEPLFQYLRGIK